MRSMNITKLTERYINSHPSVRDCIRKKLVNYSSLARQIAKDSDLDIRDNFDAILIACRRYFRKLKKEDILEKRIIDILQKSKLEVKNKIIVVVVEKGIYFNNLIDLHKEVKKKAEVFHVIEGSGTITIITTSEFLEQVKKLFRNRIIKVTKDLAEINLKSSEELERTPGVIAYLTALLAENNINITETMSAWTDTLFVISEKDIAKVMEILTIKDSPASLIL
ncbi:ACT domain-containing protein [Candidatus Woesearchaeota archaeon]|nr:ACT domain-containing protein [Candidatus Woesearchaeota archaeon]